MLFASILYIGTIPQSLYSMKQLTALGLNSNKFEGPLPNIAAFPILQRAYLDQNNFRGSIYENITTLNKLKVLSISNNELSGPHQPALVI